MKYCSTTNIGGATFFLLSLKIKMPLRWWGKKKNDII